LLLLPSLLCAFLFQAVDQLLRPLGPLRWVTRIGLSPLLLLGLPAVLALPPQPDEHGREVLFGEDARRFEVGPWERGGVFTRLFTLGSGGRLRFHAPQPLARLNDPLLARCLADAFEPEPGVRWGGLRMTTFGGQVHAFYVVAYAGECVVADFTGTAEEEALADALFHSLRRSDEARATAPRFVELKAVPNMPRAEA